METSEEILKNALNVNHTLFIIKTVIAYRVVIRNTFFWFQALNVDTHSLHHVDM